MVATDSSRSSVRTRYAAPHPGPPPRLSVAVAGSVGFGGCVVSIDPWRLWLLCGYFATTFLSAPLRRGAGSAGRSRGSGVAVGCLVGVHDGCVQGLGGDAARRPRPPACGAARRRRPRPRAPVKSPVSWCGGVFAVFSRRVRGAGSAPSVTTCPRSGAGPQRPGGSSAGRVPVTARGRGMWSSPSPPRSWAFCTFGAGLMGPGRGAWGLSPLWCCLCGERRGGRRAGAGRG